MRGIFTNSKLFNEVYLVLRKVHLHLRGALSFVNAPYRSVFFFNFIFKDLFFKELGILGIRDFILLFLFLFNIRDG